MQILKWFWVSNSSYLDIAAHKIPQNENLIGLIELLPEESSHKYQLKKKPQKNQQTKLFKALRETTPSPCCDTVARAVGLKKTEYFPISFRNFICGLSLLDWRRERYLCFSKNGNFAFILAWGSQSQCSNERGDLINRAKPSYFPLIWKKTELICDSFCWAAATRWISPPAAEQIARLTSQKWFSPR